MNVVYGVSWNDSKKGRAASGVLAFLMTFSILATVAPQAMARMAATNPISVIVRELPGSGSGPEHAVTRMGGSVGMHIGLIHSFVATVPQSDVAMLRSTPGIVSVTRNRPVHFLDANYNQNTYPGSLINTAKIIGAQDMWRDGFTGAGVDVALVDSGVAPVHGLTLPGKVINGPDISADQGLDNLRYLDEYGHGTHMAGIIAAKDEEVVPGTENSDNTHFMGIAPDARIVSVKVGNAVGAADVSQVIAGIAWVIQHRNDNGMNIRVLNLSFGTDGTQSYLLDPLAYAAEMAWRKGIFVVVSAGNSGYGTPKLNDPAYDPFVMAVGANDPQTTYTVTDDAVPGWSSKGDSRKNPDIVAPGRSIVSLRDPGSYIDLHYPSAIVNDRFFKGSGTSQSAAVVSGAAALLIQQRPTITPDQLKALMVQTASPLPGTDAVSQGAGEINLRNALHAATPSALLSAQSFALSTGTGSLDLSRGSIHVTDPNGTSLAGEQDIFGQAWVGATFSASLAADAAWTGGTFNGMGWSGMGWSGMSWSGMSWSGMGWSGMGWSGSDWSGMSWSAMGWSGMGWSGGGWNGAGWTDADSFESDIT